MKEAARKLEDRITHVFGLPVVLTVAILISCWAFIATQSVLVFAPLLLAGAGVFLLNDVRNIYLVLFLFIPLSLEVYLPMGLGTDVPTEQCMWLLTGLGIVLFLFSWRNISAAYIMHPITILVLSGLAWILITTVASQNVFQSFKYFLARSWYVVALFFMTLYFVKSKHEINQTLKFFFAGLLFTVTIILIRHGMVGFSFEEVNFVLWPFYRNHVNYACLLAISLPYFYWYANSRSEEWKRQLLRVVVVVLLLALYFTYTRAAILATAVCPVFYFIIRKKLVLYALSLALIAAIIMSFSVIQKYNYLAYAPNYATTIQHKSFDDVLSATYQLEDLSTMERVYRWVAGYNMIRERPLLGFGPANFYVFYKAYTVEAFTTYVSDNEDQSGIHNYYLMLLVEQGFLGLIIFIILVFYAFYNGQRLYASLEDAFERKLILAALGSLCITLIISLMNDMLETDKVGTLFLFSLALLVRGSIIEKNQKLNPI